jgi:hypothetical protein
VTKIIEFILTTVEVGKGTEADPERTMTQLYSREGILIAEDDSSKEAGSSWFHCPPLERMEASTIRVACPSLIEDLAAPGGRFLRKQGTGGRPDAA